ncbi:MAG: lamin tail domain-containing protein, partial [Cyclobacteriaceae bacterium]|nr:lamin tail domain-containing protein [Cyclobacteriaceae bacterium]
MYTEFWVASRKNGLPEDQKRVKLNVGVSLDGGKTFPFVKGIGPHEGFPNANTAFEKFMFVFPPAANGQANVVLRFLTKSSGGPHRPATLLLDDIDIIQAPSDIFPPYIMGNELPISGLTKLTIPFSEPLLPSVALNPANYQFLWPVEDHDTPVTGEGPLPRVAAVLLSPDGYTATLTLNPPMLVGETYLLEMYAMTDLNGNTAATLSVDGIVYNEPAPGTLVFSEVLFADPSRANPKTKLQYVEIFNASTDIVPLGGLRIKGAIAAHNLPNVKLKPGEFWVATRNA